MLMLLGQSGKATQAWSGLLWIGVVIVIASVGALLVSRLVKRWRFSNDNSAPDFTLSQLRELRDCGELTIPEYDALKEKIVSSTKF